MKIVGQELKRVDAYGKVTGEAKYTADDMYPEFWTHKKLN